MFELKKFILRRISHCEKRVFDLKTKHGSNPSEKFTYHGGWDLGYWQGRLAAYESVLDELEEMEPNRQDLIKTLAIKSCERNDEALKRLADS